VSLSLAIRITYVIPTLDQSGAERQLTLLATNLPKSEYQVNVITLNRGGYYAQKLLDAGIQVNVLEKRFRFDPLTFIRLRQLLKKTQPDIVQSFLFSANSYVRLPGICPAKSKVIVSERCVDSWKTGWQLKVDRWLSSRMDAMTANSASVADFYEKNASIPSDLITVIPNGIPAASASEPETDLRKELGVSSDAKLVGYVGRLAPQKCLPDLIWAFQLLHQVVDNVFLVLVGQGPERDQLAELAQNFDCRDKVFFLGHRKDAQAIMQQLDAFCLPSSFEGMSNSLMEAMSASVPVVVSDIPANLELVERNTNGLVFPLGIGPTITKAFKSILTDETLAKQLGLAAQKTIQERHSVQQLVDSHMELYRRLTTS
jgi:glycosyltransferase involved in cell wall biosynthesis